MVAALLGVLGFGFTGFALFFTALLGVGLMAFAGGWAALLTALAWLDLLRGLAGAVLASGLLFCALSELVFWAGVGVFFKMIHLRHFCILGALLGQNDFVTGYCECMNLRETFG